MEAKKERLNLTIKEAGEPKPVGKNNALKLNFKATAPDGKDYQYFTFIKTLFEHIKAGQVLDCDVEISSHDYEGNTYTDRKVVQVYINGQPVEQKQQGGRGNYQKSNMTPEQWAEKDRIERSSIEAQVAFKGVMELAVAGKCPADVLDAAIKWAMEKLGGTASKPAREPAKSKSESDKAWEDIPGSGQSQQAQKATEKSATTEERLNRAMEANGYNAGQVKTYVFKTWGVTDWKKLSGEQFLKLINAVENCQVPKQ